jgi:GTP-binding protein EngB required for normal cell division
VTEKSIVIFSESPSSYKTTQLETKLLEYSNNGADERRNFFKSFLNEIKPDLVQIQQHSIENYLREIQLRIGLIMLDNEEMKDHHHQTSFKYKSSKDSIFPFQSFQFLNDPNADYHFVCNHIQCISTYKVSLRLNGIGMSYILKLHVKNAFKEVISEKEGISNEKTASFTFDMLKYDKIEISVVSIFGESPLVINYKDVVKLDKLTGKELKIATMPLEELYKQSFSFVLWKEIEIFDNQNFSSSLDRRKQSLRLLNEIKDLFPEIKEGLDLETNYKDLLDKLGGGIIDEKDTDMQEKTLSISYKIKNMETIHKNFCDSSKKEESNYPIVQALLDFSPLSVAIIQQGICRKIEVHRGMNSLFFLTAGCVLVGSAIIFPLLPGFGALFGYLSSSTAIHVSQFLMNHVAAKLLFSGVFSFGLAEYFKKQLDSQYETFLLTCLESFGRKSEIEEHKSLPVGTPYILEKEIYEIYSKFGNDQTKIKKNWGEYFPNGTLSYVIEESKQDVLNSITAVMKNYELRKNLSYDCTIGVVGVGKSGKSTLVKNLFGFDTKPHHVDRTITIQPFEIEDSIHVIDFPHSTSRYQSIRSNFFAFCANLDLIIVVLKSNEGLDSKDDEYILSLFKTISKTRKAGKILFCFNKYDEIIKGDLQKRISSKTVEKKALNEMEYMKSKASLFLQKCKDASIGNTCDAFLTSFDFSDRNPFVERKIFLDKCCEDADSKNLHQKTREVFDKIGIKGPKDVMNWVIEALEENQIDKFRLESVKKFASMEKIFGEESEFEFE